MGNRDLQFVLRFKSEATGVLTAARQEMQKLAQQAVAASAALQKLNASAGTFKSNIATSANAASQAAMAQQKLANQSQRLALDTQKLAQQQQALVLNEQRLELQSQRLALAEERLTNQRTRMVQSNRNLATSFLGLGRSMFPVLSTLSAGVVVGGIIQMSDTWKQLTGRLQIVSSSMAEVTLRQNQLFEIAQRTGQPLANITDLYTRLNNSIDPAKRAQYDLLGVTETVAKALAITGEGSAQAASAILQFSQAVGSDFKASSQEINSLLDSAPRLAQAIQRSIGDGTKSLKQLAEAGQLSRKNVLEALSSIGSQGQQIAREFEKIPMTVGRAFTELRNSLIKFIGENGKVLAVTNALASAIIFLADNLDTITTAIAAVAAVITARLVSALVASAAGWIANTAQIVLYQIALGRMAGYSTAAATGLVALGGAATILGRALALVGGPIGLAALLVVASYGAHASQAAGRQAALNKIVGEYASKAQSMTNASAAQRRAFLEDSRAKINAMIGEVNALAGLIQSYEALGGVGKFFNSLGQQLGLSPDIITAKEQYIQLTSAIEKMMAVREGIKNSSGGDNGAAELSKKQADTIKQVIEGLQDESMALDLQIKYYGQKEDAVRRARKEQEIATAFMRNGVQWTAALSKEIGGYLDMLDLQHERFKKLEDLAHNDFWAGLQKAAKDMQENMKGAGDLAADVFNKGTESISSVLSDFVSGSLNSFDDLRKGIGSILTDIAGQIAQFVIQQQIIKPLLNSIFGAFGVSTPASTGSVTVANAHGNAFANGRVAMFAKGGVVNQATAFPMRGGTGVMGEAGPEAVMPLRRLSNGDLGVQSASGGGGNTQLNYSPNFSFQIDGGNRQGGTDRTASDALYKQLDNEVQKTVLAVIQREQRPGGSLAGGKGRTV